MMTLAIGKRLVVLCSLAVVLPACVSSADTNSSRPLPPWDPGCEIEVSGRETVRAPHAELWVIERAGQLCEKAALDQGRCKLMDTMNSPYPRVHEEVYWTGREILVWGGCRLSEGRLVRAEIGASFDPATNQWTPMGWQGYAEKRALAANAEALAEKPIELVTSDWIDGAVLDAHLLETRGATIIWGGWVTMERAEIVAPECLGKAAACPGRRFELIPDGVVITWTGKIQCNIHLGGRPLSGATVRVLTGSKLVNQTETNKDGACTIDLAVDTYTVEISKAGFQTVSYPVTVRRSEESPVDVELAPAP